MKTKLFTLFLALAASVGTMFAESGTCGDNLTWDLTDGVLTISGTGTMTNFEWKGAPWESCRTSITEVSIGNGVTSIGDYAFFGCTGLTSITIPNSITEIRNFAFNACYSLTSITIPNSVTSIGRDAFKLCSSLTSVHISDLAAWCSIAFSNEKANPLNNAHHLYVNNQEITDELIIPNGVTSLRYTFAGCSALTSVIIPNSVTSIVGAFEYCTGLASVTIPNSVTSIGSGAFYGCSSLTSVTIPNSVTSIGEGAFYGCSGLASVTIPNSVTSIGAQTFYGCSSLTSVTIPNSVTSIEAQTFYGCSSLTSVTIPNSVTFIYIYAFLGCTGLTSITCEAVIPPYCNGDVFSEVDKSIPLYVPAESVTEYQSADVWKNFYNIIGINAEDIYLIESATSTTKILRDGQILIQKGDKIFDLRGQEVK